MRRPAGRPAAVFLAASALLLGAPSPARAEELTALQGSFLRGDYDGVVREARRMEQESRATDAVLYLWGVSALKRDHADEGREVLARLIGRYPSSRWRSQARLALGQSLEASGQDEEALRAYRGILRDDPSGPYAPRAALQAGRVQMRLGLWEESRSSLQSLVQREPESPEAAAARDLLNRGNFYYSVQVGSFSAQANAERLAAELKRRGYSPEVTEGMVQGKHFYRVRLGRFSTRGQAEQQLARLREDGIPGRIFP